MLEIAALTIFALALLVCITLGLSILLALGFGLALFWAYGRIRRFTFGQLLGMSVRGVKKVQNVLFIFLLIGMLTAVWRACGTIPFIIYHASGLIVPSAFALVAFLLCCLVSVLTGTSFGTAATAGVICMTFARAMDLDPVLAGGAIMSGIFVGDRCSPMSSSALLICELTGTDIYRNIKNMVRTSAVPFAACCALYGLLGLTVRGGAPSGTLRGLFEAGFNLHPSTALPAVLVIVLCLLRVHVKIAMAASIVAGGALCLAVQGIAPAELLKLIALGFRAQNPQLAAMIDGGGIVSMVRVAAIVSLSSSYAGIFEGTGLLNPIRGGIVRLSGRISAPGAMLLTALVTSMVACNQALSIMLTHQLCKDTVDDPECLAVHLENTAVLVAPLVPWSIAGAVPLAAIAAPLACLAASFYLYLVPLWNLVYFRFFSLARPPGKT